MRPATGAGESAVSARWLQKAFEVIDASTSLGLEQKAGLEFAYVDALASLFGREKKSHLSNLEKYVERQPDFYVQALAWAYRRKDGKEDPPEFKAPPERKTAVAERAYKMLEGLSRLPGYGEGAELRHELILDWVQKVRALAAEIDRLDVADICIGKLLSRAPEGADGVWPCEPVRQVMEDIQSRKMLMALPSAGLTRAGWSRARAVAARNGIWPLTIARLQRPWSSRTHSWRPRSLGTWRSSTSEWPSTRTRANA